MFAERRNGEGSFVGGDALKDVNGVVVKRRGVLGFCWCSSGVSFFFYFGLVISRMVGSGFLGCAYKVP